MRHSLLAVLAVVVLTGCNTMVNQTYQKIAIHTPGLENVDCILETDVNKYRILAPGTVNVERSFRPLTVTCEKAGYVTNATILDSRYRMVPSQLNILNGVLPGMAYDFASNSVYGYPEIVVVNMVRDDAQLESLPSLQVMRELPKKKEIVTPADVSEAKAEVSETAGDDDSAVSDLMADQVFSESLLK